MAPYTTEKTVSLPQQTCVHTSPSLASQSSSFHLYSLNISCQVGEKLICELSSFSILWPLNKACAVPVSASVSLLAVQIWLGKEPRWPRWGALGWARTPAQVRPDQFGNNKFNSYLEKQAKVPLLLTILPGPAAQLSYLSDLFPITSLTTLGALASSSLHLRGCDTPDK